MRPLRKLSIQFTTGFRVLAPSQSRDDLTTRAMCLRMQSLLTWVPVALALLIVGASDAHGRDPRPVDSSGYSHDRFGVEPKELMRDYGSFIVSFDSDDDDDGDGGPDNWGIPVWVAHEIKAFNEGSCIKTGPRPKWFTDTRLAAQGVAPRDATYVYSRTFRKLHPDWYVRGHLAMKFLAERMGPDAAWNTHTLLNAVPQRQSFNAGPWLELEELTGAWAQRFGAVWIITGPIIIDGKPSAFIGEEGEIPAAIPDALFKIVVRDSGVLPEALAFIYPQVGPGYQSGRVRRQTSSSHRSTK